MHFSLLPKEAVASFPPQEVQKKAQHSGQPLICGSAFAIWMRLSVLWLLTSGLGMWGIEGSRRPKVGVGEGRGTTTPIFQRFA